jgi:uncharacterized membrane protein
METFKVGSAIRYGWETFKKRPWFLIGVVVVYGIVSWVIQFAGDLASRPIGHNTFSSGAVAFVIQELLAVFLAMGMMSFLLKAYDNIETVQISDLWHPDEYWQYLIYTVLLGIVVVGGLILLIVPGIIFSIMFMFSGYLIVERKLSAIDAMKESARITKGHKGDLFLLMIASMGVVLLGLICLIVGVVVAFPVIMLAQVWAYRTLSHAAGTEVAAAPAPAAPAPTASNTSPVA